VSFLRNPYCAGEAKAHGSDSIALHPVVCRFALQVGKANGQVAEQTNQLLSDLLLQTPAWGSVQAKPATAHHLM